MKVQCGQCPAKYAVSDERVLGRKVRLRCRRCGAAIIVDGKVEPPVVTSTPATVGTDAEEAGASEPPGSAALGSAPPVPVSSGPSPAASHTILGGHSAPSAKTAEADEQPAATEHQAASPTAGDTADGAASATAEHAREARPDASRGFTDPPSGSDSNRYRVALTKNDMRFMTTEEIAEAFRAGVIQEETFVFKRGMPSWVTLLEVAEIAEALGREVYAPSSAPPPPKRHASAQDGDADTDEPLPFELVPQKPTSSSSSDSSEAAAPRGRTEDTGDAFLTLASAPPESASELLAAEEPSTASTSSAEGSHGTPSHEANAADGPVDAPQVPSETEKAPSTARPKLRSGPSHAPSPAEPAGGSNTWLWLLVLLLAAVALYVLGPELGLNPF